MLSAAGNTLTLTAVNGNTTCPGGDLVFNCTITATTDNFNFNWRREGATLSSGASYLYTDGNNKYPSLISFDDFTINSYNIPPDYTLTSIHCYTGVLTLTPPPRSITATIVLQGYLFLQPLPIATCIFLVITIGAQNPPSNLTIALPAMLTWLPPAGDLNCSFNYTFNNTNSSSVTEQMHVQ